VGSNVGNHLLSDQHDGHLAWGDEVSWEFLASLVEHVQQLLIGLVGIVLDELHAQLAWAAEWRVLCVDGFSGRAEAELGADGSW